MPRNSSSIVKVFMSVSVLLGGIGYLFYSSAGEAFEYYKHVDEVMAQPQAWRGKHLQIHGFVKPGSIQRRIDKQHQQVEYKFTAINCEKTIDVRYAGTVPDTFKDGAEVVLKGTLDGEQAFKCTEVSAKCPSKYSAGVNNAATTMCAKGNQSENAGTAAAGAVVAK